MRLICLLLGVVAFGLTGACAPSLDLQLYTGPRLPSTAEGLLLHKGSACPVVTLVMAHDDAFIGKPCQADPPVTVCTLHLQPDSHTLAFRSEGLNAVTVNRVTFDAEAGHQYSTRCANVGSFATAGGTTYNYTLEVVDNATGRAVATGQPRPPRQNP